MSQRLFKLIKYLSLGIVALIVIALVGVILSLWTTANTTTNFWELILAIVLLSSFLPYLFLALIVLIIFCLIFRYLEKKRTLFSS